MKKAIGYIRVSTDQQALDGVSLDAQAEKIRAYCQLNDLDLIEIKEDRGVSGKTIKARNGVQDALSCMKKGMTLVVYSLSRLARSTKDCIEIAENLKRMGCDLVSLTEKIDTSSAMGEFFFTLIAALGQMERKLIAERTATAMQQKKKKQEVYSPIPFGYKAVEGKLVQVEKESKVIAEIIEMRNSGSTYQAIADYLNGKGITGKKGGAWKPASVRYVINNNQKAA